MLVRLDSSGEVVSRPRDSLYRVASDFTLTVGDLVRIAFEGDIAANAPTQFRWFYGKVTHVDQHGELCNVLFPAGDSFHGPMFRVDAV